MTSHRVVVLAKAGAACDRTVDAVRQAGAEVAAVLDPTTISEYEVLANTPNALLFVLDAATEAALDKFDGLLANPGLEVLFDDADVAVKRTGWEAARWARHLAAKLTGSDNVLPDVVRDDAVAFETEMRELSLAVNALPVTPRQEAAQDQGEGAVVIVAGVGGPDAVRQLLGEFAAGFPRAILLRQRIEGAQYDRLVRQMQRATTMPVELAQAGAAVQRGNVHVMPDGLDVVATATGLAFAEVEGEPHFAALRPADSAMLLLSGAGQNMVDVALTMSWAGGLAIGQAPENCFDPAATQALIARGGDSRSLPIMARQVLDRWPH